MGKSKPNRHRGDKPRPTGLVTSQEMEEIVLEMGDNTMPVGSTVSNVMTELQSETPEQRECGCNTIANLVTTPEARSQLISADAVRALGPLLIDPSYTVRSSALGALRNLSVEGGAEMCEVMVQQDSMSPLVMMLQKMCGSRTDLSSYTDDDLQVITQALHLLLNLCESSETAVKIFNSHQLISLCLQFLSPDSSTSEDPLYIVSARCIYTVSDSNPEVIGSLSRNDVINTLSGMLSCSMPQTVTSHTYLFYMYIIGVLQNINGGQFTELPAELVRRIMQIVVEVLTVNISEELTAIIGLLASEAASSEDDLRVKQAELGRRLGETQRCLSAQQVALEVLTNLCCDEDDDAWVDEDGSDTSSDEVCAMPVDTEVDAVAAAAQGLAFLPADMTSLILSSGILQKVVEKSSLPDTEVCQALQGNTKTSQLWEMIRRTQSHGLLCLSNMLGSMGQGVSVESSLLLTTWAHLAQLSRNPQVVGDGGLLEDVTRALRAVVQKLCHDKAPQLLEVTESDLQFLSDLSLNCPQDAVRANAMGIASAIGCSLVKQGSPTHALMKPLGQLLCEVCRRDTELHVVAEALDAIFDVFAEDETDPVASDINLVGTLVQLSPLLKSRVKQMKGKLGEHHGIISTARTNLARFIKYKAQRLS